MKFVSTLIVTALTLLSTSVFAQAQCQKDLNTGEYLLNGKSWYTCSFRISYNNDVMYGWWTTESSSKYLCGEPTTVREFVFDTNLKLYVHPEYRIKVMSENAFEIESKAGQKLVYMKEGF